MHADAQPSKWKVSSSKYQIYHRRNFRIRKSTLVDLDLSLQDISVLKFSFPPSAPSQFVVDIPSRGLLYQTSLLLARLKISLLAFLACLRFSNTQRSIQDFKISYLFLYNGPTRTKHPTCRVGASAQLHIPSIQTHRPKYQNQKTPSPKRHSA